MTAPISGTLSPALGGDQISVAYSPPPGAGGTAATHVVATGTNGFYSDNTYVPDVGGMWTATATFAGNATEAPAHASCTLTVLGN